MNRQATAEMHSVLSERNPDANVAVIPQQDGAKVVITGSENGSGTTRPHNGSTSEFRMRDGGTLMQVLAAGSLPRTADQVIYEWSRAGARYKQIAAGLAMELAKVREGTRFESSMKIAKRYNASNAMVVNARRQLLSAGMIHKSGRRYVVGPAPRLAQKDN